jgi:tetratricopeptide (TPR) repeat protein
MNRLSKVVSMSAIIVSGMVTPGIGSGGGSSSWTSEEKKEAPAPTVSLYDQGMKADSAGNFKEALELFREALKKDKKNPEIMNMIAHSERKLGMLNQAIDDYWNALKLRPKFPQAREYMGEAYIQAVLAELETLKGYGKEGEEEREDLLKALKDAAANAK